MRVSVITPNLNHARFLRQTMRSVIAADPGDLDYIVMDGGSSDGSVQIIEEHAGRLSSFSSEPDGGLYNAINRGFARTNGDIMGWINAGDLLFPDSLSIACEVFTTHPEIEWITSRVLSFLDEDGRLVEQAMHHGVARDSYLSGEHLQGFSQARTLSLIQQESTFWRRSLWERAGARLDTSLHLAADFELWARFFKHAQLWSISAPLGAFRRHSDQLSRQRWGDYLSEAHAVLIGIGSTPRGRIRQTVSVGLRRALPAALRPLAHRLHLFSPAPVCAYDFQTRSWHLYQH